MPMQGTWFNPQSKNEDAACHGLEPVSHNQCGSTRPQARALAARETPRWSLHSAWRGAPSPLLEKAHAQQQRLGAADSRLAKKENHDADALTETDSHTDTDD